MIGTRSPQIRLIALLTVAFAAFVLVAAARADIRLGNSASVHRRASRHSGAHHGSRHKHPTAKRHGAPKKHRADQNPVTHKTVKPKSPAAPKGTVARTPSPAVTTPVASPAAPTTVSPAAPTTPSPTILTPASKFYVYPSDSAVTEENTLLAQHDTSDAAQIEKLASQPEGIWLTSDSSGSVVPKIMSAAAGSIPIFVVYDLPGRDCGGDSSGGASGASDYEAFINTVVAGLGQGKADVIVEPDALTYLAAGCSGMSSDAPLIKYATQQLDTDANASVYVDAGNPDWESAAAEAGELNQVLGSTKAGFAVNVSNFFSTSTDISYGTAISQAAGGRHFIVDTSRNGGSVTSGQWCNPSGAAIGTDPTTSTGNSLVDALLWVKDVGESDGNGSGCNGGPSAGSFWLSYALSLATNG